MVWAQNVLQCFLQRHKSQHLVKIINQKQTEAVEEANEKLQDLIKYKVFTADCLQYDYSALFQYKQ